MLDLATLEERMLGETCEVCTSLGATRMSSQTSFLRPKKTPEPEDMTESWVREASRLSVHQHNSGHVEEAKKR